MSESYPIEEVDEPTITADDVSRRVDDWLKRLDNLFKSIKSWAAKNNWVAKDGASIPMREELMRRFGLPMQDQPSLSLRSLEGADIWIKPKGLWVIGANGRVDLYTRKGAFTLVDVADAFQEPQWVLHRIGEGEGQRFQPEQLADIV